MSLPINKIIHGDCVTVMKMFPSESIDLIVTSPPYDNLRNYEGYKFDFENIAKELFRIIKVGKVLVWVVGDATIGGSETGTSFVQVLYFKEVGFNLHDTMIYEKKMIAQPSSNRYFQIFEFMFVLSKGKPKTVNLIKDRKNLLAGVKARWGKPTKRQKDGTLKKVKDGHVIPSYSFRTNIWSYLGGRGHSSRNPIAFEHPAIFPEKLAKDHIISWSNEGDIVLDPMVGSGTTCFVAKQLNRKWIGIDCSSEYCNIASARLGGAEMVELKGAPLRFVPIFTKPVEVKQKTLIDLFK